MGHGLKTIAKVPAGQEFMTRMFDYATITPLAGLCVGILLTSIVQSSSFTTSFAVGLVAAGQLTLTQAVPIIMGANIGTSVTNILVSLAHMRRKLQFRRSLGGAIVHDFFNVLCVLLLLPLEWRFGILSRPAKLLATELGRSAFAGADPGKLAFVKIAVKPVTEAADWLLIQVAGLGEILAGSIEAALAVVMLFIALYLMVRMLQGLLRTRLSGLFSRTLFRTPGIAFFVGILITVAVQSSSVTTSLVVPLVGAGVLSLGQIYPYILGANIGTTVTAMLAALALAAISAGRGEAAELAAASGLGLAMAHLLFNLYGTCVFWPLKWIPISLAEKYAKLAARRRLLAGVYILGIFFILPITIIVVINLW